MARTSQWEKAKDLYKAEMIQRRDDMLVEYGKTLSEWEAMDRLEKYYWIAGMHSAEYFKKNGMECLRYCISDVECRGYNPFPIKRHCGKTSYTRHV